jgi:PhnB protein
MDAFWGDRYGKLADPYGHQWGIATHKEDVSPEDMGKRAAEFFASMGDC